MAELVDRAKNASESDVDSSNWRAKVVHFLAHLARYIGTILVIGFAVLFLLWLFFGRTRIVEPNEIVWGVTYSPLASEGFRLESNEVYDAIIDDLKPDRLRLVAYWNRIEQTPNSYDFSALDYQVQRAEEAEIPYTIAVGRRVPRYPECHEPDWAEALPVEQQEEQILELISETMQRYEGGASLERWQIENEPFLGSFGDCPPLEERFLAQEIELARSLTDKPIQTTESGELSVWFKASQYPDVLGTTLYRRVLLAGTNVAVNHVFPPAYYRARSNIMQLIQPNLDKVIVAELQGEPWAQTAIIDADPEDLARTMNPEQFNSNIDYTESIGFPEVYLWGVEWWYYEKLQGEDFYWERFKELRNN